MDDIFSCSPDLTDVQQLQAQFEAAGTAVFPNGCSPRVVPDLTESLLSIVAAVVVMLMSAAACVVAAAAYCYNIAD